ncbi:MAG: hypothetical protein ACI9W4_000720 [Rhodothermales bacterium]|jgi:hypothetical protein
MPHTQLQSLIELGDAMLAALDQGDVERFSNLLERRGRHLRSIRADLEPTGMTDEARETLETQTARLEEAMRSTKEGLEAAVSAVSQFRSARNSYRKRQGAPRGRLNKSLHG